jgi:putative ABC transport system ATP-binding protein
MNRKRVLDHSRTWQTTESGLCSRVPASVPPVLVVRQVIKHYGPRRVLDEVSFHVGRGERVALTGPSGSGKTTLLNCLGGVDRLDAGQIVLQGDDIHQLSSDDLARVRRSRVGTIFQFFHLLPTLTAAENIELPLQLQGVSAPDRSRRVQAYLDRVGLAARAHALPSQLSGGEQQRVAIARALVHEPAVVLADEPTGNLDSANGAIILALLRELTDETGVALVLVTHSEEAAAICHRRIRMLDGRVIPQP